MTLTKRILDFLNKDVSKLFKREYVFQFPIREDKGLGVFEIKRYDKKTGAEIPYENFPPLAIAVCLENRISCYN
ncbi:MAG: hypothetical protein KJ721_02525 [Nanoarchaeota archaeon]|nr:hypothetical protein [Nanoarchaeota archaeon]